jgi:hypothetical protein
MVLGNGQVCYWRAISLLTRQTVRLPNADFSIEESDALLHAIFPNYPDITGMKPAPEIGMFLRTLRTEKESETDQSKQLRYG